MNSPSHSSRWGGAAALFGFLCWGLFPLYWKQLHAVPAWDAVAYRVIWSALFLGIYIAVKRESSAIREILGTRNLVALFSLSSVLLVGNWLIYVWAVNAGFVIEASLGYFLVPLVNVLLGRLYFGERMRAVQKIAIALAAVAVLLLLFRLGHFPFIALGLAGTWATYGLMKKKSAIGAVHGLTTETFLMLPVAVTFLAWRQLAGGGIHINDTKVGLLLAGSGLVTALPLIAFAYGAQRIRMTALGLIGYVTPSVQFVIGYAVYHEVFDATRWQSFGLIWVALAVYSADTLWASRRAHAAVN